MALNKVEYDTITGYMNNIKDYTSTADANLKKIDTLVNETVGVNGSVWSGDSATGFKQSWDGLADDFNNFVKMFNQQAVNIQNLLTETSAVDTVESGSVQ